MSALWQRKRLGAFYDVRDQRAGSLVDTLPLMSVSQVYGVVPRSELSGDGGRAETLVNYKICEPGDIVLNRMSAYNGALGVARQRGLVSPDYLVMQPREGVNADFVVAWLKTPRGIYEMTSRLRGIGSADAAQVRTPRINESDLRLIPIETPLPEDQRTITGYLDRETVRIDTLIEEQQRLIELLRSRKIAILDELTANAMGEQVRLKYLFIPSAEANRPSEKVLSVYRDYGVIPKASRDDNFNRTPENVERYLLVRPGDIVINRMKAWQGSLGVSEHRGIVSGDYEVLRPLNDQLVPRFTHLFLRSPRMIAEYAVRSTGIRPSQWRLYWDQMGNIEMPVPPRAQQITIVERVDSQVAKIDTLIDETERFIELARERRAALITSAVTGQLDVRETA